MDVETKHRNALYGEVRASTDVRYDIAKGGGGGGGSVYNAGLGIDSELDGGSLDLSFGRGDVEDGATQHLDDPDSSTPKPTKIY